MRKAKVKDVTEYEPRHRLMKCAAKPSLLSDVIKGLVAAVVLSSRSFSS